MAPRRKGPVPPAMSTAQIQATQQQASMNLFGSGPAMMNTGLQAGYAGTGGVTTTMLGYGYQGAYAGYATQFARITGAGGFPGATAGGMASPFAGALPGAAVMVSAGTCAGEYSVLNKLLTQYY
ncbi:hypothetical protein HK100_012075 [Physocladia obscura]|uniref:Uncharacterized protein n=1 Tax=Physocladia obscura TaxID=109957 RepID=A0AAD5T2W2_9FUNG|nr:hypothetical protein HK100_012075 [Physocladia obscura]